MLNGTGPAFTGKRPIEDYEVGLLETAGAAVRYGVDSSFLADQVRGLKIGLQSMDRTLRSRGGAQSYDAETARRKVTEAGVEMTVPDDGMSAPEFDTMLALRKRQKREEDILARRPKTWAGFGAQIAGDFAASTIDPINVAAAFIPVVGPARYALWLERAGSAAGRAGIRAGVGATEGLVGSTLYEAVNVASNRSLPESYGLADSFLNIAFGTALGSGLHVMAGAGFDAVTRSRRAAGTAPEGQSRAALTEALTAADNGRRVDVAPVFRRSADPLNDPMADTRFLARETSRSIDVADSDVQRAGLDIQAARSEAPKPDDLVEAIKAMGGIRLIDKDGVVTSEGGDVRAIFDKRYPPGLVNNKTGIPLDGVRERLQEEGWLRPWDGEGENPTSINDVLDLLGQWKGGKKPLKPGDYAPEDMTPIRDEMRAAGVTKADSEEVAAFKLARHRAERAYAEAIGPDMADPVIEPDVYDPSTGYEPQEQALIREQADEAAMLSDDGTDIDGEVEALGEYLNMARKRETLTAADEAAMALADEFAAKADLSGRAYKAASACLSGLA